MAKNKKYWVGVDLGGTKMLAALLNRKFKVLAEEKSRVETAKGEKHFISTLVRSIEAVLQEKKASRRQLGGIGIGCPGIIDRKKGEVVSCPNIRFLRNYPLARKIKKHFHVPVTIENDVNTGLYGEHQFGAAEGCSDVIGIFLGTGIGGALILDGKLYRGKIGAAGEIGHMLLDPTGPVCGCGKRGCLEAFSGRVAISSEAAALAQRGQAPHLFREIGTEVAKIKSKALARAIAAGDHALKELLIFKARLIGTAAANLVNVLNPEMIVLGGGLVEALPHLFVREIRDTVQSQAMMPMARQVKVVPAKLKDYAIILGAAKMVSEKV